MEILVELKSFYVNLDISIYMCIMYDYEKIWKKIFKNFNFYIVAALKLKI